jgi:hypothetical protein
VLLVGGSLQLDPAVLGSGTLGTEAVAPFEDKGGDPIAGLWCHVARCEEEASSGLELREAERSRGDGEITEAGCGALVLGQAAAPSQDLVGRCSADGEESGAVGQVFDAHLGMCVGTFEGETEQERGVGRGGRRQGDGEVQGAVLIGGVGRG